MVTRRPSMVTSMVLPCPIMYSSMELSITSLMSTYMPSSDWLPSPKRPTYMPGRCRMCSFHASVWMLSSL